MRVLRLRRATSLLTASVFEDIFEQQLGSVFDVHVATTDTWFERLLGAPGTAIDLLAASRRLGDLVAGFDFVAPNYEAACLAPLLLELRNRAHLATRLLLVAHAPGAWPLEWALLGALLRPGDVVVAPSHNAAQLIAYLDPQLAGWVQVIPHPMEPLPAVPRQPGAGARLVSLSRMHPGKLLHRQIEALHLLRQDGAEVPRLEIAGAAESASARNYRRSLDRLVERLDLSQHVRFVGSIRGAVDKATFLAGARALVNLSCTPEESFGKAPVEALGCGVPVLATGWNGLPETVGPGGLCVPVTWARGYPADVGARAVAAGLRRLLSTPPTADVCRMQAARCAPGVVLPRYRACLDQALAMRDVAPGAPPVERHRRAAPDGGLLAQVAPLTSLSWPRAFALYLESCQSTLGSWAGQAPVPTTGDQFRAVVFQGCAPLVEAYLAGQPIPLSKSTRALEWPDAGAEDLTEHVVHGARDAALLEVRTACLLHLWQLGRGDALRAGLEHVDAHGSPTLRFLGAERARLAGDLGAALDQALAGLDLTRDDALTAMRLRQAARLARAARQPERAMPALRAWLEGCPDGEESAALWLAVSVTAAQSDALLDEAEAALAHASALLEDTPVLEQARRLLATRRASLAIGEALG